MGERSVPKRECQPWLTSPDREGGVFAVDKPPSLTVGASSIRAGVSDPGTSATQLTSNYIVPQQTGVLFIMKQQQQPLLAMHVRQSQHD